MELILIPTILIGVVLYTAWPLLQDRVEDDLDERTALEIAEDEKQTALSNLKDIEMDYRMGKLSDEDYERLKSEFEVRAVEAMEKVEALQEKGRKRS